jgi:hypothetical protein
MTVHFAYHRDLVVSVLWVWSLCIAIAFVHQIRFPTLAFAHQFCPGFALLLPVYIVFASSGKGLRSLALLYFNAWVGF